MKRSLTLILILAFSASMLFAQTTMRTELRDENLIPQTDPYLGSVTVTGSLPVNMVDWVLVELRETTNGATIAQAVGCLLSDGSVTDTTGTNGLTFAGLEPSTPYYIVVRHRNHISVMSDAAVQIDGTNGTDEFDFSTGNVQGGPYPAMNQVGEVWAMIAGDADSNDEIQTTDKNYVWNLETGKYGYFASDFDMNTEAQTIDKNYYYAINVGRGTGVPAQSP